MYGSLLYSKDSTRILNFITVTFLQNLLSQTLLGNIPWRLCTQLAFMYGKLNANRDDIKPNRC